MSDPSASTRNLVIGMLFIAAPFAGAYLLTRSNPDAQVLLIIAVFCAALGVTFAFASGVQQVAGLALRLSGRSSRDIAVVGLAALTLLTPWTIDVSVGHLPRIFGWANPLAWLVALGLVLSVMQTARPYHGQALLAAGLGLVAWVGWASWLVTTPAFRNLHFSFMPIDVISTGWYAGVIGFVLAVDGFATGAAKEPTAARANDVWTLALVPGMGLLRLGFAGRGRIWLLVGALALAFTGVSAVNDSEFAYWAHYNTVPPDRGRLDVVISVLALALIYLGSWLDTWRSLRRRRAMGAWLARVTARPRSGTG